MKRGGFRLACFVLALVLGMGLSVPIAAAGEEFEIEDGILKKYNGSGGDVEIPEGVREIGGGAFQSCVGLTSVKIPEGVREIGDCAFAGCVSLKSVEIPEGVREIGGGAFSSCNSLTSVEIPEGVREIGFGAFGECRSLTSVTIPARFAKREGGIFMECPSLTDITYVGNVEEDGDFVIWSGTLVEYTGFGGAVTIPDSVEKIGEGAFGFCTGLTRVAVPDSVEEIGDDAFWGCRGLVSVSLPAGFSGQEDEIIPAGVDVSSRRDGEFPVLPVAGGLCAAAVAAAGIGVAVAAAKSKKRKTPPAVQARFCPRCGGPVQHSAAFCPRCGAR